MDNISLNTIDDEKNFEEKGNNSIKIGSRMKQSFRNFKLKLIIRKLKKSTIGEHNIYEKLENLSSEDSMKILNTPAILDKMYCLYRNELLKNLNSEDSMQVLNTPTILDRLDSYNLVTLLEKLNPEDLIKCFKNTAVLEKIDDWELGQFLFKLSSEEIMKCIISPEILDKLDLTNLCTFLEHLNSDDSMKALNTPVIFDRIDSSGLKRLLLNLSPEDLTKYLTIPRILRKLFQPNHPNRDIPQIVIEKINELITKYGRTIICTMDIRLFDEEIIKIFSKETFEKLCIYQYVAEQVVDIFESDNNLGKCLSEMIDSVQGQHFSVDMNFDLLTLTFIQSLRDETSPALKFVRNNDINSLTKEDFLILSEIALSDRNINVPIETVEDLKTYKERLKNECDNEFQKVKNYNFDYNYIYPLKNAYFNKYYGMSLEKAEEIITTYGYSLDSLDERNGMIKQNVDYLKSISKILELDDFARHEMEEIYNLGEEFTFDQRLSFEQSIPQMFARNISNSLYKINETSKKVKIEGAPEDIEIYEPSDDFKMLVHSTGAYNSDTRSTLLNDNYNDAWNNSDRITNHGICCGLVSNSYMGIPPVGGVGVIYGFDSFQPRSLVASAPYDLGSISDDYDIFRGRQNIYMTADEMINASRTTHNEQVIDRYEMRDGQNRSKIQPSYVIITSDTPEDIRQNAYKCSREMNIPVVYLDKQKIAEREKRIIDEEIKSLDKIENPDERIKIIKSVLCRHENNRSGERIADVEAYQNTKEKYFPSSVIESFLLKEVKRIIILYQNGNITDFAKESAGFINALAEEENKFELVKKYANDKRLGNIDIQIQDIEAEVLSLIPECRGDISRFKKIVQEMARKQQMELEQLAKEQLAKLQEESDEPINNPNNRQRAFTNPLLLVFISGAATSSLVLLIAKLLS